MKTLVQTIHKAKTSEKISRVLKKVVSTNMCQKPKKIIHILVSIITCQTPKKLFFIRSFWCSPLVEKYQKNIFLFGFFLCRPLGAKHPKIFSKIGIFIYQYNTGLKKYLGASHYLSRTQNLIFLILDTKFRQ